MMVASKASYTTDKRTIEIAASETTRKACAEAGGVMEQESAHIALLHAAVRYRLDGTVCSSSWPPTGRGSSRTRLVPGGPHQGGTKAPSLSGNRWWASAYAGRQCGIPLADSAGVLDGRAREVERDLVGVRNGSEIVPVEDEFAEARLPACRGR